MLLGAQLYSVRDKCTDNESIRSTLKALKEFGYESVQVSGFTYEAERVRAYADEFNLHIGLTHTSPSLVLNNTEEVIKTHKILGVDMVGIGYPDGFVDYNNNNRVDAVGLVSAYTDAVKKIQDSGLHFGYHNHAMEFYYFDGERAIDYIYENTNWKLILDTGWAHVAGSDIEKDIAKFADRLKYVHLKDFRKEEPEDKSLGSRIVSIYKGATPIDEIWVALEKAGCEVAYVEQDTAPNFPDSLIEMKNSIDAIKLKGWIK